MKIQSRIRAIAATVLAATATAAFAVTYTPETYDPARSVRGTITDYRRGVITVESGRGEIQQFDVRQDTGIAVNGNVGTRGDLRAGMQVEVTPAKDPSVATSIVARAPTAREGF